MYDAIVVGARCAGAPTAMLLARQGHDVLLVDRSTFPSDIMSTHFIHGRGVDSLTTWGLLDRVLESGCPKIEPPAGGADSEAPEGPPIPTQTAFMLCPRRTVLDKLLVDAAVEAGAELRERFSLQGLLRDGDGAVTGVEGRDGDGNTVREQARVVIGADGLRSPVARMVEPEQYYEIETLICAYYSYFSGVEAPGFEIYVGPNAGALVFATHDDRHCIAAARPVADFARYRGDIDGVFIETLAAANESLGTRVRAGKREERWVGTAHLPQYFRKPYGPGWALVGDAGLHIDPTMGMGITKAFTEVEMLVPALDEALSGKRPFDEALADFQRQRDEMWTPLAEMNVGAASAVAQIQPPAFRETSPRPA